MKLFKDDSERAIDRVIDFFGSPMAGRDMCGELTLELLCADDADHETAARHGGPEMPWPDDRLVSVACAGRVAR
jgi:hypothetical protein